MDWTLEQIQAIEYCTGRLTVVAGAGSGKTGVLTERFVYLVHQHGVDPERILTITFTRTATAEMKTRIVQKLEQLGRHDARQRLENAYIHTVHALCRRLLQENPFEAGVEPDMVVLPATTARQLSRDAFHRALEEQLTTRQDSHKEILTELIGNYLSLSRSRRDPLETLYQAVRSFAEVARHQGLTLEDLQQWEQDFPHTPLQPIQRALQTLLPSEYLEEPLESFECLLHRLQNAINHTQDSALEAVLDSLYGLANEADEEQEARAHQLAHALLRLTITYLQQYERLKERLGALDFDDMQVRTLKLLRESATVRHRYQRQFEYVLVDETQDIDPLQAQIIEQLSRQDNLMVVGDAQQSIYGFRHADPRIFRAWQEQTRRDQSGKVVYLQDNFRSHPDILGFVEKILAPHWTNHFMRLQARRRLEQGRMARVQVWYRLRSAPSKEAEQIASTIRHWVEQKQVIVHDPEIGEKRPVRYGDFALLFKQFTHVEKYENQFRQQNVPYFVVGGGRGYWLQYEVRDMANLMRLLNNSLDEVALLSVLRSPFVGLGLDALMSLVLQAQIIEVPLFSVVFSGEWHDLEPEDAERLARFIGWFEPLRQQVGYQSVGWLLARALEHSAYEAKALLLGQGRQIVANIRKLLAIALDQPTITPVLFADQLEMMSRTEQREGHAPTFEENADVVRFYTVHGAKGLEFPVVFVVDTAFRARPESPPVLVEPMERLIGLTRRASDQTERYDSFLYRLMKEQRTLRDHEELLRMLYVALTRSRDYLIVAFTHNQSNAWSLALARALRDALNSHQTRFALPSGGYGELVYCDSE